MEPNLFLAFTDSQDLSVFIVNQLISSAIPQRLGLLKACQLLLLSFIPQCYKKPLSVIQVIAWHMAV